jgi:hypothetical protein
MAKWVVALCFLFGACVPSLGVGGGDGLLDCGEGEVTQSAGITSSGSAEEEVAKVALKGWAANGATVAFFPEAGTWSAVKDGHDIAVAIPETSTDGTWKVSSVEVCTRSLTGGAPIDGVLDCVEPGEWSFQGILEPNATGMETAEIALTDTLGPFEEEHGGKIVIVNPSVGSLVVDQRERVVAVASELDDGTWTVIQSVGCSGYGESLSVP